MSELKDKPLTESLGPFLKEKRSKKPETRFSISFLAILGSFGHPQIDPKIYSKSQVGEIYGAMSKLKNKLLTKWLGPLLKAKWSKTSRKQIFMLFFCHFGAIWAPPNGSKKVAKDPQVGNMPDV
jgi:hypothetical protein